MSKLIDFQQQLNALRQAYLEKLPARVRQIESLWAAACDGACSQDELNTLYEAAHQLNGSGDSFGFQEITEATSYLEVVIKNLLVCGIVPTAEDRHKIPAALDALKNLAAERLAPASEPEGSFVDVAPLAPEEPEPAFEEQPTVLIAEDEAFLRAKVGLLLRSVGFNVLEVDNGLKALDKARKHNPDLILMDVMMPTMDGLEATRRIHEEQALRQTPIIIMTSKNTLEDLRRAFTCGIDDYIVKPFKQDQLVDRVRAGLANTSGYRARPSQF